MVLLQKAISSVFNLILTSNVRLEDDVREVKKSISTELIFNAVFKRIAYLEMEKLLPSFTQMQQEISSVLNLILTSNVRLEDDVREVKKSISTELIFNAVFKRIAYLEMEKLLPSFTQMQQEKKIFPFFV